MKIKAQLDAPRTYFAVDIDGLTPSSGPDAWTAASTPTGTLRVERDGTTVEEITGTVATVDGLKILYAEYTHNAEGTDYVQWLVTVNAKTEPGARIEVEVTADVIAAEA